MNHRKRESHDSEPGDSAEQLRSAREQRGHGERPVSEGRFATSVAQEFNDLLSAILGSISLAELSLRPDEPAREHLVQAAAAARAAATLARQLLAASPERVLEAAAAPPADEALPTRARPVQDAPVARGRETILLVEDEDLLRSLARTVLERQGYRVIACQSGAEAVSHLQQLQNEPIDLLLTDVMMPGMGGSEVAERVRALRPNVRVLYTSGYTEDAVVHRGVHEDPLFLPKPYSVQELARRVRDVLDYRS